MTSEQTPLAYPLGKLMHDVEDSVSSITDWMTDCRRRSAAKIEQIPLRKIGGWQFDAESGNLTHTTGRFFSIEGVRARTTDPAAPTTQWEQPIIQQRDVAILGLLVKRIDGELHVLTQAKMEPGNINLVQLSPTVQSTTSNYQRAHKGSTTHYVEHFVGPGRGKVLVDVLQSEQGAWFRGKRNRNIVVETHQDVPPHPDFRWLTVDQLVGLLRHPHVLNMDMRTVLSCLLAAGTAAASVKIGTRSWLTEQKTLNPLSVTAMTLGEVRGGWTCDGSVIAHQKDRYFRITGVSVDAASREVASWCQPLVSPVATGLTALLLRRRAGRTQALVRADVRPGYRDGVEIGPTVQCTPENYQDPNAQCRFLETVFSPRAKVLYDVDQSEEGGRFLHAATRHLIIESQDEFPDADLDADFRWVDVAELAALNQWSHQLNIEARSLLLCLHAVIAQPDQT